jgi:hypothetical protein
MKRYESLYTNSKNLTESRQPFEVGDKVTYLDSFDGLQTVDTVFDIWKQGGKWKVELDQSEMVVDAALLSPLK